MSEKEEKDQLTNAKSSIVSHALKERIKKSVQNKPRQKLVTISPEITGLIRAAFRTEMDAQQSRKRISDAYTQKLRDTDARVTEFIQQAITETSRAYRLSVNSYIVSHVAAFIVLIAGLVLIFFSSNNSNFFTAALVLVAGGILWVISLQNRNPVKNSRQMVNHLGKLNVIFAGYIRQMNQVDAVFENLFDSDKEITLETAEQMLNHLQDAMAEAINAISRVSTESDE